SGDIFRRIISNDSSPLRWPAPAETARHGRLKSTPVARSGRDRSPRSTQVHSGGPPRQRPLATVVSSPLRWPAPAETARHDRLKSTPVARSGGDRSPRSSQVHSGGPLRRRPLATVDSSPLQWPAPAETARHGRLKSTPVARSGGDRSPRSTQVHSGGLLRRRPLATVGKSRVREVVLAP